VESQAPEGGGKRVKKRILGTNMGELTTRMPCNKSLSAGREVEGSTGQRKGEGQAGKKFRDSSSLTWRGGEHVNGDGGMPLKP